ncbi:MAG: hypothetical protein K9N07_10865 [Candidatus Cloacimonetes bacterium]|nr:hypothetical protein [Candidatus Cloacimonadota bacterium]
MKQTVVEWLVDQLEQHYVKIDIKNTVVFEQANKIFEEQITDAHRHGFTEGTCFGSSPIGYKFTTSEQYYNETFKSE